MTFFSRFHHARRSAVAPVAVIALAVGLSACQPEPARTPEPAATAPVRFVVDSSHQEQVVLGELYSRTLHSTGRQTYLDFTYGATTAERIEEVETNRADVAVVCIGAALAALDPRAADELSGQYSTKVDAGEITPTDIDFSEDVFDRLVAALPGGVHTTNFSPTHGCADEKNPRLPQNVITVYRKPVLRREEWDKMNAVSGAIDTDELRQLENMIADGADPHAVYHDYMQRNRLYAENYVHDEEL